VTLPNYAVVSADGKTVLSVFKGLDRTGGKDFLEFLNAGLQRWEAIKEGDGKSAGPKEASETVVTGQFPEANYTLHGKE